MYLSFLKRFVIFSFISVLVVISFNYFIDPYGIYSQTRIQGINHSNRHETLNRMSIALRAILYKPKSIVLGSSRVLSLEGFTYEGENIYNMGIPSASFDEMYSYFLHALYLQPDLKRLILGIDLFSFNEKNIHASDYNEERLGKTSYTLKDLKDSLFTYKTLYKSLKVIDLSRLNKKIPYEILTVEDKVYLQHMLTSEEYYKNYHLDLKKIEKFKQLVDICRNRSIDLKVFICPVRALYWEFYIQNDLWAHVLDLKRQLSVIFPLWDFSGFNPITTETLESEGNALYHECSHCTTYTGSLLLKRMFNQPSKMDSIGYLLTPENFEFVNAEIFKDRQIWLQNNH